LPKCIWLLISPQKEIKHIAQWFWKLFAISMLLVACSGTAPPTETIVRGDFSAATLPPALPSETPTSLEVEASPTNASHDTLEDVLASYGLERWIPEGGDTSQNPITPDVLSNPATYGAFLDELDDRLKVAKLDVEKIASQGDRALVEVYWNGVSSYSEGTEVDIFYRGVDDPAASLWIRDEQGKFSLFEVNDLTSYLESLPADAPIEGTNPGRLSFLNDPWDNLANGLHIIDAEGRAIALWDRERSSIEPWMKVSPHRYKIVNGMDVDYFGFSEDQLDVIWEALAWINLDEGNVKDNTNAPRQADVLWIAAILVHEAVHINQPGECSPQYAATQGMSFEEYGLFVETGPGQAYEQEVRFIERTLALKDSAGNRMVRDSQVRAIINEVNEYYASALGRASFADGVPVPTCANP